MTNYKYDAFLSFAVEDKEALANPLYEALLNQGLNVWYSGREFQLGISIKDQIKEGLEQSRFGILLITPNYFQTNWAQKELGALWGKERDNYKIIIPVFHNITPEEVGSLDPDLAERWSVVLPAGDHKKVAEKIHQKILNEDHDPVKHVRNKRIAIGLGLSILIALAFWQWLNWEDSITETQIHEVVGQRIDDFNSDAAAKWEEIESGAAILATKDMVGKQLNRFDRVKAQYRNYYQLKNGYEELHFEKNVTPATGINFQSWSYADDYGMTFPKISMFVGDKSKGLDVDIHYFNTQPVTYSIDRILRSDGWVVAIVSYQEPLRLIEFHYEYGTWTSRQKHTTYSIMGFKRQESYHFALTGGNWELSHVE